MEYRQKLGKWFKANKDKMMVSADVEITIYATNSAENKVPVSQLADSPKVVCVGDFATPSTITDIVEGTWFIAVDKNNAGADGDCIILV